MTSKHLKCTTENAGTVSTSAEKPVYDLDLDALNEVNADIRNTERLIDANLTIKKQNDANRKALRNLLIELNEQRRKIISGK